MKKVLEILKYSYSSETNRYGQFETYRKEHIQKAIAMLEEAIKPKTCKSCKHYSQSIFYVNSKIVEYCHENRLGIGAINFQIFCCNKHEPKDSA